MTDFSRPLMSPGQRAHEFPLLATHTYLNTASEGLLPARSVAALAAAMAAAQLGSTAIPPAHHPAERVRDQLSTLLSCSSDRFALTSSTTHGMNICARGIDWQPGDNVVIPADEFPSLARTWLQLRDSGVQVRVVPRTPDGRVLVGDLMAAVDRRTRAVTCSAVSWDTGALVDLAELGRQCRAAGVLSLVDGVQAVGAVELNLPALGLSAVSFHGYKWLLSGWGQGVLYVAADAVAQIAPRFVGEQAFVDGHSPYDVHTPYRPGARRYAAGGANLLGLTALECGLALLNELGSAAISRHNRGLATRLIDGLHDLGRYDLVTPLAVEQRAGIVVFSGGSAARDAATVEQLREAGISVVARPRGVRAALHLYTTTDDVDRLLNALESA